MVVRQAPACGPEGCHLGGRAGAGRLPDRRLREGQPGPPSSRHDHPGRGAVGARLPPRHARRHPHSPPDRVEPTGAGAPPPGALRLLPRLRALPGLRRDRQALRSWSRYWRTCAIAATSRPAWPLCSCSSRWRPHPREGWIRRLGKRWLKLHRLVYPAAALGVLHFYWKVRADTFWPLLAALALAVLLAARSPSIGLAHAPRPAKPRRQGGVAAAYARVHHIAVRDNHTSIRHCDPVDSGDPGALRDLGRALLATLAAVAHLRGPTRPMRRRGAGAGARRRARGARGG